MRRAAAWAESVVDCHALERVREATGAESVVDCHALERVREATGASVVKSQDRVRVATGSGGGARSGSTLGDWRPLGVGM